MKDRDHGKLWWPAILAAAAALCLFTVYKGIDRLQAAREELTRVEATNKELMQGNRDMYQQVRRLRGDQQALERAARREMGMVRQDEVVYRQAGPGRPQATARE